MRSVAVYSLHPKMLLKKHFIKYISLQAISNYSQLLSYRWNNCDQLPVKLPRLLRGNNLAI